MWRLARTLSGTGCMAKRRWRAQSTAPCPPVQDWIKHLEQPGSRGGQRIHVLWTGPDMALPAVLQLGSELLDPPNNELLTLLSLLTVPPTRPQGNWDEACDAAQHDIEALYDSIAKHTAAMQFLGGRLRGRLGDRYS